MIYLDHAATTPMRPGVWEAMAPFAADRFGNPSGVHAVSRRAKDALEQAREEVASLLGARTTEVVFTSGGTESDNLAVKGPSLAGSRRSIVTVATEHEAVLEAAAFLGRLGHRVTVVGVDTAGRVAPASLAEAVTPDTAVVSVMAVNNETGVVTDLAAASRAVRDAAPEVLVHTDAVQAFGAVDLAALDVDMLSLSAHKFGGPRGAGVLLVREGTRLEPLIHGGGQEAGRRSGTNDVAAAVGLAAAMSQAAAEGPRFSLDGLRNDFEKLVLDRIPDAVVNGGEASRGPHHSNLRIPGVRNEDVLIRLDRAGVAASAGSACQSGAPNVSHVLTAMGLSREQVRECLRFSFGWTTTQGDVADAASALVDTLDGLR